MYRVTIRFFRISKTFNSSFKNLLTYIAEYLNTPQNDNSYALLQDKTDRTNINFTNIIKLLL